VPDSLPQLPYVIAQTSAIADLLRRKLAPVRIAAAAAGLRHTRKIRASFANRSRLRLKFQQPAVVRDRWP